MEVAMAEIISHEFGSGNNVDSNARGMGGLCEKEPLNTCRMSRKSTNDEDPHMYETLDESEFRIRLLNSLGIEQGIMDSKGKRKKTKVSLKEQLCTVVLIAMATCLVVSNVTLLFLFMNAKSPCTDADVDDCMSQPCLHGACSDHVNGYNCTCLRGYTGINCETDIDDCTTVDCGNGTCIDGVGNYFCACNFGFSGRHCEPVITDCYGLYHYYGQRTDGVYTVITRKRQERVDVYCDMTTDGGGWTVFQYRFNGSVDFDRKFSEYDDGFGNLNTEFWLGLRYIQEIASQRDTDLRIDVEATNGTKGFEKIEKFRLSPGPNYTIYLGQTTDSRKISGNHSFGACYNGSKFSSCGQDVNSASYDCAGDFHGSWWYTMRNCSTANLNGQYLKSGTSDDRAMVYDNFLFNISLKSSRMMLRRRKGEYNLENGY